MKSWASFACACLCLCAAALSAATAAHSGSGGGVVCSAPIPHTTKCYGGEGASSTHSWRGMGECCAACANVTDCATWVHKKNRCLLLNAKAKPKKNNDCQSGSSLPGPLPPPSPSPTPGPGPPAGHDPLNPKLPPNRWGPYIGRKAELVPEYGFVSGFMGGCGWGAVEAVRGQFNFSACEAVIDRALEANKFVSLSAPTGSAAPVHWLAEVGVPTVKVCFKEKNCTAARADHEYPYYLAPAYFSHWQRYQQAFHDWLKQLPMNKQGFRPVESIEVSIGSTGDITPWHGTPLEPKYHIDGDVWKEFWVNGSRAMWEIHKARRGCAVRSSLQRLRYRTASADLPLAPPAQDLLPDTKLIFNGVPTNSTPEPDNPDAK